MDSNNFDNSFGGAPYNPEGDNIPNAQPDLQLGAQSVLPTQPTQPVQPTPTTNFASPTFTSQLAQNEQSYASPVQPAPVVPVAPASAPFPEQLVAPQSFEEATTPVKPKKKSKKRIIIPIVVILLALILGCGGYFAYGYFFNSDQAILSDAMNHLTNPTAFANADSAKVAVKSDLLVEAKTSDGTRVLSNISSAQKGNLSEITADLLISAQGQEIAGNLDIIFNSDTKEIFLKVVAGQEAAATLPIPDLFGKWYKTSIDNLSDTLKKFNIIDEKQIDNIKDSFERGNQLQISKDDISDLTKVLTENSDNQGLQFVRRSDKETADAYTFEMKVSNDLSALCNTFGKVLDTSLAKKLISAYNIENTFSLDDCQNAKNNAQNNVQNNVENGAKDNIVPSNAKVYVEVSKNSREFTRFTVADDQSSAVFEFKYSVDENYVITNPSGLDASPLDDIISAFAALSQQSASTLEATPSEAFEPLEQAL